MPALKTNTTLYAPAAVEPPPTESPEPEPEPEPKPYPEGDPSMDWRKAELLAWADENGLAVDESNTKAEILEAIEGTTEEDEG